MAQAQVPSDSESKEKILFPDTFLGALSMSLAILLSSVFVCLVSYVLAWALACSVFFVMSFALLRKRNFAIRFSLSFMIGFALWASPYVRNEILTYRYQQETEVLLRSIEVENQSKVTWHRVVGTRGSRVIVYVVEQYRQLPSGSHLEGMTYSFDPKQVSSGSVEVQMEDAIFNEVRETGDDSEVFPPYGVPPISIKNGLS
jgi:hypothetical protein